MVISGERGGEADFINVEGEKISIGEKRILKYDVNGSQIVVEFCGGYSFGNEKESLNVKNLATGDRIEIDPKLFLRLEKMEAKSDNRDMVEEVLPCITSYELRLLDNIINEDERKSIEDMLRQRMGVAEDEETKKVLLDGSEVLLVVDKNDFGTVIDMNELRIGSEVSIDGEDGKWTILEFKGIGKERKARVVKIDSVGEVGNIRGKTRDVELDKLKLC